MARRRSLRNVDVVILFLCGIGLALVSGTEITDKLLSAFSFEKGNGGRILGLAVFAIFILFLLILRALSQTARNGRQLSAALEGLAWEEFRQAKLPERFRGKIAILVPAFNEAENIGYVLDRMPAEVCGAATAVLMWRPLTHPLLLLAGGAVAFLAAQAVAGERQVPASSAFTRPLAWPASRRPP